jgi:hypothetical protein
MQCAFLELAPVQAPKQPRVHVYNNLYIIESSSFSFLRSFMPAGHRSEKAAAAADLHIAVAYQRRERESKTAEISFSKWKRAIGGSEMASIRNGGTRVLQGRKKRVSWRTVATAGRRRRNR